jgi:hypothetical protein
VADHPVGKTTADAKSPAIANNKTRFTRGISIDGYGSYRSAAGSTERTTIMTANDNNDGQMTSQSRVPSDVVRYEVCLVSPPRRQATNNPKPPARAIIPSAGLPTAMK